MVKKTPAAPRFSSIRLRDAAAGLGIFVLLLIAYLPALNGGLVWDDEAHITTAELQSWHSLWRIWFDLGATQQYYPLLHSAFWIEHTLWGDSVLGYHLANLAMHASSAFLVMLIMRRLALPGAGLGALIFALHPVCVESVAWISEQKNTLSSVFYLASALIYLRFDEKRRSTLYLGALGLFLLALLSKSVTATLPAALLVVLWWRRGRLDWRRDFVPLAPWLAIGIAGGIFTAWVEKSFIGAGGSSFALSVTQRCLLAGRVIWFYLAKTIWPVNLMFVYPRWTIDPTAAWQYLFLLGALALTAALIGLARRYRGPLAGFLFFVGTLVPALGFVNVYPFLFSYVADHFQYLASLGVIVPAASSLAIVARRSPWGPSGIGGFLVTTLGILTWSHSGMFRNAETLYRDTLTRNPGAWLAESNLGSELLKVPGRAEEAVPHLEAALRLKPDLPEAHNNLGLILSDNPQRLPQAIAEFEAALLIKPNYAEAHNNLGSALSDAGRREEAISEYRSALRLRPNYAEAHNNLGITLSQSPDHLPEAIAEFQAALAIDPGLAEAQANLATALAKIPGRLPEAILHMEAALRMRPQMQPWRQILAQLQAAQR
jgi:tetratricopeptide (TPR) repeat protein